MVATGSLADHLLFQLFERDALVDVLKAKVAHADGSSAYTQLNQLAGYLWPDLAIQQRRKKTRDLAILDRLARTPLRLLGGRGGLHLEFGE